MTFFLNRRYLLLGFGFLAGFGLFSAAVNQGLTRPEDLLIAKGFHDRMPDVFAWFFGLVCRTGNVEFSLPLWFLLLYVIFGRTNTGFSTQRREAMILTMFFLLGSLLEHLMKRTLHQPLPFLSRDPLDLYLHPILSVKTPFSYPSGHTLRAFMIFSLVGIWAEGWPGSKTRLVICGIWAAIIAIGVNAIGWHWTSDVIGSLFFVGGAHFLSRSLVGENLQDRDDGRKKHGSRLLD